MSSAIPVVHFAIPLPKSYVMIYMDGHEYRPKNVLIGFEDHQTMEQPICKSNFFFWGKRTYVQGSHVAQGFLTSLREWGHVDLEEFKITFLSPIRHQGEFVAYPDKKTLMDDRSQLSAMLTGTAGGKPLFIGLMECDEAITEFEPDDEIALLGNAVIDREKQTISTPYPGESRLFTYLVALNKHLLKTILPTLGYASWIVSMLSLKYDIIGTPITTLSIRITNNVGSIMVRSKIFFSEVEVGEIHFTRRKS